MFADIVPRKTLVLDLDETLIHSHHDGVLRQTVKPGTPPDFVLKVRHSVDRVDSGLSDCSVYEV
jgi:TFIIF-interacting CTD phosphatase-like protein